MFFWREMFDVCDPPNNARRRTFRTRAERGGLAGRPLPLPNNESRRSRLKRRLICCARRRSEATSQCRRFPPTPPEKTPPAVRRGSGGPPPPSRPNQLACSGRLLFHGPRCTSVHSSGAAGAFSSDFRGLPLSQWSYGLDFGSGSGPSWASSVERLKPGIFGFWYPRFWVLGYRLGYLAVPPGDSSGRQKRT